MIDELTNEEIEEVLRSEVIARIGCHAGGMTYVVPITYVYDGHSIIGHSHDGMKTRMMRSNPRVCVEVEQLTTMADWKCVIAWGEYEELSGSEAMAAMKKLIERLEPLMASETSQPAHDIQRGFRSDTGSRTAIVYRISLTNKTGRSER